MIGIIQKWFRKRVDLIQADNNGDVRGVRLLWDILLNSIENAIEYGRWALHMIFLEPWRRIIIDVEDVRRNRVNSLPELLDSGGGQFGIHPATGYDSSYRSGDDVTITLDREQISQYHSDIVAPIQTTAQTEDEGYEWETKPLPPAFLNANEYPFEWLVYHPMLGVTLRRKLDGNEAEETAKYKQEPSKVQQEDEEEEKKCDSFPNNLDCSEQTDQQWESSDPPPRQNDAPDQQTECRSMTVSNSMPVLRSTVIT